MLLPGLPCCAGGVTDLLRLTLRPPGPLGELGERERDLTEKLPALRKGGGDLVGEPPLFGGGGGFAAGGAVVGVGGRVRQPAMPIMLCNTPCCQ